MNRIHTITVPYAVMKACPMSWVQRVHIHKGSADKTDNKTSFLETSNFKLNIEYLIQNIYPIR